MTKILFRPQFSGPIEGHAVNMSRRYYPMLAAELEFEDLLQEAWVVFLRCRHRYRGVVDNPAWFMAIFSVALRRRMVDLLRMQRPYISIEELAEIDEPATDFDSGFGWRVLCELPTDMRELLLALFGGESSALPALKKRFRSLAEAPVKLTFVRR